MAKLFQQLRGALHGSRQHRLERRPSTGLRHERHAQRAGRTLRGVEKGAGGGARYGIARLAAGQRVEQAALSRTEIDTQCCAPAPASVSPMGARLTRPRDGFSPNRPHSAAGMRIEPPPSVACAIGRPRAATMAAEPPEDPPGDRSAAPGIHRRAAERRLGGRRQAELAGVGAAHDDQAGPAHARDGGAVGGATGSLAKNLEPSVVGVPAHSAMSCLTRKGTPWNGPSPAAAIDLSSSSPS